MCVCSLSDNGRRLFDSIVKMFDGENFGLISQFFLLDGKRREPVMVHPSSSLQINPIDLIEPVMGKFFIGLVFYTFITKWRLN